MSGKTFGGRRVSRQETVEIVEKLAASGLSDICEKFEICGSYRRGLPDSGDIDIVALPKDMKLTSSLPLKEIGVSKLSTTQDHFHSTSSSM